MREQLSKTSEEDKLCKVYSYVDIFIREVRRCIVRSCEVCLESEKFDEDLDEVIERFRRAGGEFVINSGTDPERNSALQYHRS